MCTGPAMHTVLHYKGTVDRQGEVTLQAAHMHPSQPWGAYNTMYVCRITIFPVDSAAPVQGDPCTTTNPICQGQGPVEVAYIPSQRLHICAGRVSTGISRCNRGIRGISWNKWVYRGVQWCSYPMQTAAACLLACLLASCRSHPCAHACMHFEPCIVLAAQLAPHSSPQRDEMPTEMPEKHEHGHTPKIADDCPGR